MTPDRDNPSDLRWSLLLPLKSPQLAKSRLMLASAAMRSELVLAMACDVATVALACAPVRSVMVVADSVEGLEPLQRLATTVIVAPAGLDLNASLRYAADVAATRDPSYGIASLVADVAAITVDQLTRALQAAAQHSSAFVADAAGRGTTLVTARRCGSFLPEYGQNSRRRHLEGGFAELVLPEMTGLRLDVDTVADLAAASTLGAGPLTRRVIGRLPVPLQ